MFGHPTVSRRIGFTLVELLTVVGVIGLLVALLLPAIGMARAASQRALCSTRLSQLGVAIQSYESTYRHFPQGGALGRGYTASPQSRMLPYLGQEELSNRINWERLSDAGMDFSSQANVTAERTSLSAFLCPSDSAIKTGVNYFACVGRGPHWQRIAGIDALVLNDIESIFGKVNKRRVGDVQQGLSHVAAFSERLQGDRETAWMDVRRDVLQGSLVAGYQMNLKPGEPYRLVCQQAQSTAGAWGPHFSEAGSSWLRPQLGHSAYSHSLTPNSPVMDCGLVETSVPTGAVSARSNHSGGVHVLFADGHVEFVADSVDPDLWLKMATILLQ